MTPVPAVDAPPSLRDVAGGGTIAVPRWYAHRFNRAGLYRMAAWAASALPRPARLRLAEGMADLLVRRFPVERRVVADNIARITPDATAAARDGHVRSVFRNFAMCFADLVTTNRRPTALAEVVAHVRGEDNVTREFETGRGVIVLTAHLGNWDLAGRLLSVRSRRRTHVLVATEADRRLETFLRGGPSPVSFVPRTDPRVVVSLMSALRRKEIVAMQGDRALGTRGDATVPFFGAPAPFPLGPFVLARAAGVALVPAFCTLEADRRYEITVGEPIRVSADGDGERAALERWVDVLERQVRARPQQWFNFFDIWSATPAH